MRRLEKNPYFKLCAPLLLLDLFSRENRAYSKIYWSMCDYINFHLQDDVVFVWNTLMLQMGGVEKRNNDQEGELEWKQNQKRINLLQHT